MQTLEITLRALQLKTPLAISGHSLLQCNLIVPRPGIRNRIALKTLKLRRGVVSYRRTPFHEAVCLKEKIDGRFGIQLHLTRPQRKPEQTHALQTFLAAAIEATGDTLAAQVPLSALRNLVRVPFDQLANQVEDDSPDFLLTGGIDLESETLTPGEITIPLQLTKTLRHTPRPPGPKSRESRKAKTTTHKKGLTIAEAVMAIRIT